MAKRKCPVCGKKIAPRAQYCIYCSSRFDSIPLECLDERSDETVDSSNKHLSKKHFGLLITLLSLVVIAVIVVLVVLFPPSDGETEVQMTSTQSTTSTTRNAAHDEWLQTFVGQWFDEASAGKKHYEKQGGYSIYIHEVFRDYVTFDLLSYQGGDGGAMAFLSDTKAVLYDDTLHFTFKNDGLGHSGEGFMRLTEKGIEVEVLIDSADKLKEDEHSLAVCSVFVRKSLPTSNGRDLMSLTTVSELKELGLKQTAEPKKGKKGAVTYSYGALQAVADADENITSLTFDYSLIEDKSSYSFDGLDGTMNYDIVKTYYGEALHDYVEQPTDIRVLHYEMSSSSVTFTFDADDNLLMHIEYEL